jgi:hypothetical protein
MSLVDDTTVIAAVAVLAALQLSGVDVVGMASSWLTDALVDSWTLW